MRHFNHLSFDQRLKLEAYLKVQLPKKQIAELLGVHISTVYREVKRGVYEHLNSDYTTELRYSPDIAEDAYQENMRAKGAQLKIGSDFELTEYIETRIVKDKYSPAAVLAEIANSEETNFKTTICLSTLYSYIEKGVFLHLTNKELPIKRNKDKRPYRKVRAARRAFGDSIEKRPSEVGERSSFGHWEMDCVIGKKGTKRVLLVLTERYTRNELIRLMKDKTAQSVVSALDGIEKQYGKKLFSKVFKTITVDNGSEFADCKGIERTYNNRGNRTKVYYCHPYTSCERGSNENQNRLIRRHYPKGTSFERVKPAEIQRVEEWINNYPRKIFNFHTSAELYEACLNSIN